MILTVIVMLMAAGLMPAEAKNYNILSLDGSGEGGILTAEMVSYMEKRAYRIAEQYAKAKTFCFPANGDHRIPMHKLFDMVAGSETGAIIAAILAQPKEKGSKEAKFNASRSIDYFEANTNELYRNSELGAGWKAFIYIFGIIIFGTATYFSAYYYFNRRKPSARIEAIRQLLRLTKKFVKGTMTNEQFTCNKDEVTKSNKNMSTHVDLDNAEEDDEIMMI